MNSALRLSKDDMLALRPGDVQLYLMSQGWQPKPYGKEGNALLFRHPSFRDVDLLLPLRRDLVDYANRMGDLVVALATIERRPVQAILNDLSGPSGDVFRLRVAGSVSALGNIPLDEAIKLLDGARQLLWSSAFSVIRPEALHPLRTVKQVEEFLKGCRFGQTERGSFVATILAPVPPEIQPPPANLDAGLVEQEPPFPRRVTTRLMSSLGLISQAIQAGRADKLLDAVSQGISANLCDALVMMKPPGDESRLDVQVTWAPTRPHLPAGVPAAVSFPQEQFAVIEEVGRQLRTRATARPERYRGRVLIVKKALRPLVPEVAGWMIMGTEVGGGSARIKVDLRAHDFAAACDALRDGRSVEVTGTIRHDVKAREYVLTDPHDFRVSGS
jgi:hypothetical protein